LLHLVAPSRKSWAGLVSIAERHELLADFWGLTEDGLVWATRNLQLDLTADKKKQLMEAYLSLAAFPDVKPGLEALKTQGVKLAILSNGGFGGIYEKLPERLRRLGTGA